LTWVANNGLYEVRSPIAVKGGLFSAPEAVSGNGVDGNASFDVSFGYTGIYSAAAHGLEPATVDSRTVEQDPDQSFDPSDGFSNVHEVTTTGAAVLRFQIPPEATEADADLDIFLFDPAGNFVAQSANAGTDELIEVALPVDGTWTLFVQGWSTPGPNAHYDLYSWVVSATPGGNMSIDEAPTTAVLGNTNPVGVSWVGATSDQWHLGAVSHTGPDGLLGLTLIEVDNR
jgi:hypothetical protein